MNKTKKRTRILCLFLAALMLMGVAAYILMFIFK